MPLVFTYCILCVWSLFLLPYIYISWFLNVFEPVKITIFSTDGVVHVFWSFVFCLWSYQSEFVALFVVFNLLIDLCFIFEPCS
jgi:hypothetical protein